MKKIFAIVSAFAALVACTKVASVVDDSLQEENQEIKVNFTISREDDNTGTKASVKTVFSENDVVFIFFNGLNAPKRLEMTYTSGSWTPTFYGEILASDLTDGGTLTAIYLPYGSGITVDGTGETFTFSEAYKGYYLIQQRTYEFKSNTITAAISLQVAPPTSGSDVIVHFDVTGLASDHEYNMYQEYVKPLTLTAIYKTGEVAQTVGTAGNAISGVYDDTKGVGNEFFSFSGVLDADAVGDGNAKTYQFFVRDETLGTLYHRTTASAQTISANSYIGLGSASAFPSPWAVASPGAFSVSDTKQITFARSNLSYLGATGGEHPWQLMKYPWSTIETEGTFTPAANIDFSLFGWATSGYEKDPWLHSASYNDYGPNGAATAGEWELADASKWDWAKYNTIYEYGGISELANYRTPTKDELVYIVNTRDGYRYAKAIVHDEKGLILFSDGFDPVACGVTINKPNLYKAADGASYSANTLSDINWNKIEASGAIFLPTAGYRNSAGIVVVAPYYGGYWSSTSAGSGWLYMFRFEEKTNGSGSDVIIPANGNQGHLGFSVRLVRDL